MRFIFYFILFLNFSFGYDVKNYVGFLNDKEIHLSLQKEKNHCFGLIDFEVEVYGASRKDDMFLIFEDYVVVLKKQSNQLSGRVLDEKNNFYKDIIFHEVKNSDDMIEIPQISSMNKERVLLVYKTQNDEVAKLEKIKIIDKQTNSLINEIDTMSYPKCSGVVADSIFKNILAHENSFELLSCDNEGNDLHFGFVKYNHNLKYGPYLF